MNSAMYAPTTLSVAGHAWEGLLFLPDVMWQAILDEILVLMLVSAHIDLPIILPWLSTYGCEVQHHANTSYPQNLREAL